MTLNLTSIALSPESTVASLPSISFPINWIVSSEVGREPTATLNPVTGVSNFDYEVRKNEKKRSIYLLRQEYLQEFINDMREIMVYQKSSQYVNEKMIRTENLTVTMP